MAGSKTKPAADHEPGGHRRTIVFVFLVVSYIVVSAIAYTDFQGPSSARTELSELERHGLQVWRDYNCQVCHQLYGFGGFLGPDLTNRLVEGFDEGRARAILAIGSGAMPALGLSGEEQNAIFAFLRRVDTTGRSQPRSVGPDRAAQWQWIAEQDPHGRRGAALSDRRCSECHTPFAYGPDGAPDLTRSELAWSPEQLGELLSQGKGNMPAFPFRPDEVAELSEFLRWVADNRDSLRSDDRLPQPVQFSWRGVPWFEYR